MIVTKKILNQSLKIYFNVKKYEALGRRYLFEPIAVETTGVFGATTGTLISDMGRRISNV